MRRLRKERDFDQRSATTSTEPSRTCFESRPHPLAIGCEVSLYWGLLIWRGSARFHQSAADKRSIASIKQSVLLCISPLPNYLATAILPHHRDIDGARAAARGLDVEAHRLAFVEKRDF